MKTYMVAPMKRSQWLNFKVKEVTSKRAIVIFANKLYNTPT